MSQDVIELNGKRYDAITGAYLGKSHVVPKHIRDSYIHGKVIDGVMRPARPAPKPTPELETKREIVEAEPQPRLIKKPATFSHARTPASHVAAHRPERATTLKQRQVRKPQHTLKSVIKTQAPAEIMAKPASALAHKQSAYGVDPKRQQRAIAVNKHHAVRHFGQQAVHSAPADVPVISVRPAPITAISRSRPTQPVQPRMDIFEKAIAHATSHQQPMHKARRHRSRRQRLTNTLAIIGTFLIIGGFIGYLNLPGIQLQFASMQAGFGASMPGYAPTGYALEGGVQHTGGIVTLSFRSGDSHYRVTQQSSNWNSQTLLDNTLALNGKHETIQKNGQTIYIYDDEGTNAAWVSGGVRYDITGNAQLSKDEVAAIATSL